MNNSDYDPLGPPIRPYDMRPKPDAHSWVPVPGKPWLEQNGDGQLRTKLPDPTNGGVWPFPTGQRP